jgi:hypothetical protein
MHSATNLGSSKVLSVLAHGHVRCLHGVVRIAVSIFCRPGINLLHRRTHHKAAKVSSTTTLASCQVSYLLAEAF